MKVFLFLGAASLYGTLISQVNDIVNQHAERRPSMLEAIDADG